MPDSAAPFASTSRSLAAVRRATVAALALAGVTVVGVALTREPLPSLEAGQITAIAHAELGPANPLAAALAPSMRRGRDFVVSNAVDSAAGVSLALSGVREHLVPEALGPASRIQWRAAWRDWDRRGPTETSPDIPDVPPTSLIASYDLPTAGAFPRIPFPNGLAIPVFEEGMTAADRLQLLSAVGQTRRDFELPTTALHARYLAMPASAKRASFETLGLMAAAALPGDELWVRASALSEIADLEEAAGGPLPLVDGMLPSALRRSPVTAARPTAAERAAAAARADAEAAGSPGDTLLHPPTVQQIRRGLTR
jgi:hypothetical protein